MLALQISTLETKDRLMLISLHPHTLSAVAVCIHDIPMYSHERSSVLSCLTRSHALASLASSPLASCLAEYLQPHVSLAHAGASLCVVLGQRVPQLRHQWVEATR